MIIARIGPSIVSKTLVDTESAVNVIFKHTFDQMIILEHKLEPSSELIFGFNNKVSTPIGKIKLLVKMGVPSTCKTFETIFVIIDQPSYYNALFGRSTLDETDAFASPKYLRVKFLTK